jgi:hypothetical protein
MILLPVKNTKTESGSKNYLSFKTEMVCNTLFFLYFYRIDCFINGGR